MADGVSVSDLDRLASERRNPRTMDIDLLPISELVARINDEDKLVATAVERQLPQIARAVERIVAAFQTGGRLIYVGAGTSGRIGVLDASECPPTFSVPTGMVVGLIAGGDTALRKSIEGAEDDRVQGKMDLRDIDVSERDVVVGIAASGHTPYTIGALDYAREIGASTVALTCVPDAQLSRLADISIVPVVGPEVLTGSTRMKSATAQKLVLNTLSTAAMIRIGKTYENLMVDVAVSNQKLTARAVEIIHEVTGAERSEAKVLLAESGNDVKLAILMKLTGLGKEQSHACLNKSGGFLRTAINAAIRKSA